ncbi:MAG: hypothetical protein ACYC0C_06135 [Devosia sp.]
MSERDKIEDRLRKKHSEILALEDKLRSARIYVQALQDILKLLDTEDPASGGTDPVLRDGSAVALAKQAITGRGRAMHIDDLLSALGKKPTRSAKASLTSSLAAYVRRGEIFTRPAPNTFGLIELGHEDVPETPVEPPSGFGRIVRSAASAFESSADDDSIPF